MSEYIAKVVDGTFVQCDFTQEIVRCRDCAYGIVTEERGYECLKLAVQPFEPDGFCAWGERREP